MAAKKKASKGDPRGRPTQPQLIAALTDAGYELDGFSRKGDTLVVRLTPADDIVTALAVCQAMELQARCHTFAAVPQSLLILSVKLPDAGGQAPSAQHPAPSTQNPAPSAGGNAE